MAVETALGLGELTERFEIVQDRSIDTRQKNTEDLVFEKLNYYYNAYQTHKYDLDIFKCKKTEQIIDLYNKICCYEHFGERYKSKRRTTKSDNIFVAECPLQIKKTSGHAEYIFNNEPAIQGFKFSK